MIGKEQQVCATAIVFNDISPIYWYGIYQLDPRKI